MPGKPCPTRPVRSSSPIVTNRLFTAALRLLPRQDRIVVLARPKSTPRNIERASWTRQPRHPCARRARPGSWNRGDGAAYGACFTADATDVTFVGTVYHGRVEIGLAHQALFDSFLKGTRLTVDILEIRRYGTILPSLSREVNPRRAMPKKLGKLATYTVIRDADGQWRIAAVQKTQRKPADGGGLLQIPARHATRRAPMTTIAVVGATGRTGRAVVAEALARGNRVTAIVRTAGSLPPATGLTVTVADPTVPGSLAGLLDEHHAVISALGARDRGPTTVYSAGATGSSPPCRPWATAGRLFRRAGHSVRRGTGDPVPRPRAASNHARHVLGYGAYGTAARTQRITLDRHQAHPVDRRPCRK